jgi:hypothetical protein
MECNEGIRITETQSKRDQQEYYMESSLHASMDMILHGSLEQLEQLNASRLASRISTCSNSPWSEST